MVQYDVSTPEKYIDVLEKDWRKEKLLKIRKLLLDEAPELEERIQYKMLTFSAPDADAYIFALNAQKHYVSLYVGSIEKIDPKREMLSDFNLGKGCIRVRKSNLIEETKLKEFIHQTIHVWRSGEDVTC